MLRIIRIALAAMCFVALCLLFVDVSGMAAPSLAFMAKVQLVPALLAGSVGAVAGVLLLTLVFGRVYCSVLCPLGVMQDVLGAKAGRYRFCYSSPRTLLRQTSRGAKGALWLPINRARRDSTIRFSLYGTQIFATILRACASPPSVRGCRTQPSLGLPIR